MNTSFVVSSNSGEKKHNQNRNNNNNKTKTTNNSYKNTTTTQAQTQQQQQQKQPRAKNHETQITRTSGLPSHTYKWSPFSHVQVVSLLPDDDQRQKPRNLVAV